MGGSETGRGGIEMPPLPPLLVLVVVGVRKAKIKWIEKEGDRVGERDERMFVGSGQGRVKKWGEVEDTGRISKGKGRVRLGVRRSKIRWSEKEGDCVCVGERDEGVYVRGRRRRSEKGGEAEDTEKIL